MIGLNAILGANYGLKGVVAVVSWIAKRSCEEVAQVVQSVIAGDTTIIGYYPTLERERGNFEMDRKRGETSDRRSTCGIPGLGNSPS